MVRILTKDYTELDLTKGYEFQIEMENPMLEEGHIPSAFSTQISFPPSPVNRRVFGYIPAMFLAPNVKRLEASVWIGGVPFVSGTLVYDGIEDGNLMYTFTEKIVELEGKIWERSIYTLDLRRPVFANSKCGTPLLINKSNVAVQPYSIISRAPVSGEPGGPGATIGQLEEDDYLYRQKYFNYVNASESFGLGSYIPAIPVAEIVRGLDVEIPSSFLSPNMASLAILGRYHKVLFDNVVKPDYSGGRRAAGASSSVSAGNRISSGSGIRTSTGRPGTLSDYNLDLSTFLPDITLSELLKNLCSIYCSSMFSDNGRLRMIANKDIIGQSGLTDWEDKIGDDFSAEDESAKSYRFGYAEEDSGMDDEKLEKALDSGEIVESDKTLWDILPDKFTSKDEYKSVLYSPTGTVYSGRQYKAVVRRTTDQNGNIVPVTETAYECDVLYQGSKPVENILEEESEDFDNSSDFIAVRCVPEIIIYSDTERRKRIVPIIEPNSVGGERDSKVYIGVLSGNEFSSDGVFSPDDTEVTVSYGKASIAPADLWDKYHKAFAEWLGKTRQRVSADVNLSPIDLHNFRLYRPVYFKGRKWVVAKLSVTLAAGSEAVSARGEFIEI